MQHHRDNAVPNLHDREGSYIPEQTALRVLESAPSMSVLVSQTVVKRRVILHLNGSNCKSF